jgi:hypothetical protein
MEVGSPMHYSRFTDDEFLTLMKQGLTNTLADPEMLALIAPYGYDVPRLQAGLALAQDFGVAILHRKETDGKQRSATARLRATCREFYIRTFRPQASSVRDAFKRDPGFLTRLGVAARMPKKFPPWLQTVMRFYDSILADAEIRDTLAGCGITEEALIASRARVLEIESIDQQQEALKAYVQQATEDRKAKRVIASDWYWVFVQNAKAAFADHPQWLEMLGVPMRTSQRKKAAPEGELENVAG